MPFAVTFGPLEIGITLLVALLLFGNRLPGAARSLGRSLVEFKKGVRDEPQEAQAEDPKQIEGKGAGESESAEADREKVSG